MVSLNFRKRDTFNRRSMTGIWAIACILLIGIGVCLAQTTDLSKKAKKDFKIHFKAHTFDPLDISVTRALKLKKKEVQKKPGYYIVQFKKTLTQEDRIRIQRAYGLRLKEYIPNFAYLEKLSPKRKIALSNDPLFRASVHFDSKLKISPEIYKLKLKIVKQPDISGLLLRVVLFNEVDPNVMGESLKKIGATWVKVLDMRKLGGVARIHFALPSRKYLAGVAELPGVRWIEAIAEKNLDNGNTAGTLQSGTPGITTIWNQGLHGEGQIVTVIDAGPVDINHCWFRDGVDNTPRQGHRKVLDIWDTISASNSHATFVAGILAGDDVSNSGGDSNRGVAWASRFISQNYPPEPPDADSLMFELSYGADRGAVIHTNSWHDDTDQYNQVCADVDAFTWNNEAHLVLGSSGNSTEDIGPPGTAKNTICVSASQVDPNEMNPGDGNGGPTLDGRRKPDIFAPGCSITSSQVSTNCGTDMKNCASSWATPAAIGAAALICQYYTEGWYPTGTQQPHHSFVPSGALLKATLLNSTIDMTGIVGYPGDTEGWGLIRLDNTLYFPGSARNLRVWDTRNTSGLNTGNLRVHHVDVESNGQPLKVTLAWTEPPASPGVADTVINNLDLTVTSPDSTQTFLGNRFVGGVSATGGAPDTLNNVEMVLINTPQPGDWTITVNATEVNVGNPGQGYALVVTADMPEPPVTTGNQDTLVVRVKFNDITFEPPLPNLQNLMNEVGDYFNEVALNQANVVPIYRGPIELDYGTSYYYHPERTPLVELTEDVVAKLMDAELNIFDGPTASTADDIDRMIIVTNDVNFTDDWATTGPWPYNMPSGFTRPISVSVQSYDNNEAQFTHGLGHQFNLVDLYAHPGVTFPRPYVDEWDNMAKQFTNVHFLVWSKQRAQWITSHGSEIAYIPRPAASTSYTGPNPIHLFLQESTTVNRKAIAIGLTDGAASMAQENAFYFIEARDNTLGGYDDGLPQKGVLIYYVNQLIPQGEGPVILVDKDLSTESLADAAFTYNDIHTIPGTGIKITVLAGTGGAPYDIRVDYTPPITDYNVRITKGETIGGKFYNYFSPDIWLDSPLNGFNLSSGQPPHDQREAPRPDVVNRIYARIHNDGPGSAFDFDVRFRISEPAHTVGGQVDFDKFVGIKHITELEDDSQPGSPTIIYVEWIPTIEDQHSCVYVDIINLVGTDTNEFDNGAQQNLKTATSTTSSPYTPVTYQYELTNPYDEPALFYFRAEGAPPNWTVTLTPRKILLNPGENMSGTALIEPPPDEEVCTSKLIKVTSWTPRGDTLIPVGGAVVQVDLRRPAAVDIDTGYERCRYQERYSTMLYQKADTCTRIYAKGCTLPPMAHQEVLIKFTGPGGETVYHTVMTDEYGCYEDFLVNPSPGNWQVNAQYQGDECHGPADARGENVNVPNDTIMKGFWFSVHQGVNFPFGTFNRNYDPGPMISVDLEYRFRNLLSAVLIGGFHFFHGDDNDFYWDNLSLNLKLYWPLSSWYWYLNGGGGIYRWKSGPGTLGLNLGMGIHFPIQPRLSLETAVDWHVVGLTGNHKNRMFLDLKTGIIFRF